MQLHTAKLCRANEINMKESGCNSWSKINEGQSNYFASNALSDSRLSLRLTMSKIWYTIYLSLFIFSCASAQSTSNQLEISGLYGISSFTAEKYKLPGHLVGGEAVYHFNMANNKADYVRLLNISSIDVVGSYRNLHSITITNDPGSKKGALGEVYALMGRLEIPFIKAGATQFIFTPGFGFAYSTQTYFTNGNPLVGSHINLAAQAGVKVKTPVSASTSIQAGIDIFHYSNGAYRVPNNGINTVEASVGIVQDINTSATITGEHASDQYYKHSFEFGADIGRRGVYKSKQGFYKSGFSAAYNYRVNPVFSLKGGADAVYYYTVFDPNNYEVTYQYNGTSYDRWRVGLSLGGDLWLGRFAVMANYGYYLHYKSTKPIHTYWTPGLKYYFLPWAAIQAKAYIHGSDCDYVGGGIMLRVH